MKNRTGRILILPPCQIVGQACLLCRLPAASVGPPSPVGANSKQRGFVPYKIPAAESRCAQPTRITDPPIVAEIQKDDDQP